LTRQISATDVVQRAPPLLILRQRLFTAPKDNTYINKQYSEQHPRYGVHVIINIHTLKKNLSLATKASSCTIKVTTIVKKAVKNGKEVS